MARQTRIAYALISLFVLNGLLCPCGPAMSATTAGHAEAPARGESGHAAHHAMPSATVAAEQDANAANDCHSETAAAECGMPDSNDPDLTGNQVERQLDPGQFALLPAAGTTQLTNSDPPRQFLDRLPHRQPPSTPVAKRDRLLI